MRPGDVPGWLLVVLACIALTACAGSSRKIPVKEVPVESSQPAVQAYAVPEAEISGEEIIDSGEELEISDVTTELPQTALLGELPDGIAVRLSDYGEKAVLVNYWTSACGECAEVMLGLEQIHQQYRRRGLVVLNVNFGENRENADYYLKSVPQLNLTQLVDPSAQGARAAGVQQAPAAILYRNQQEVVRYLNTISMERIRQDLDLLLK